MLDYALLSALAAVVRTGSFEQAAQHLNVTPSAVSQRIKLLEERIGAVLVVRGQPCLATEIGERLCRHVDQVALLEASLRQSLPGMQRDTRPVTLRIAVNADSLATWFIPAMAQTDGLLFDLVLDDQDHSADWLRRGEVVAAVTSHGEPVQGCNCHSLGALRYIATASPGFVERWFAGWIRRGGGGAGAMPDLQPEGPAADDLAEGGARRGDQAAAALAAVVAGLRGCRSRRSGLGNESGNAGAGGSSARGGSWP